MAPFEINVWTVLMACFPTYKATLSCTAQYVKYINPFCATMMNQMESLGIPAVNGIPAVPDRGSVPLPNPRHELYSRNRAAGLSPTESCRRIGVDPDNGAPTKFEKRRAVQQRMAWLCRHEPEVAHERKRYAEERLTLVHDHDIGEFYEVAEEPVFGKTGIVGHRTVQRPKFFSDMTREQRLCVKAYSVTDSGKPNLELHSMIDANRDYRKLHGLDMPVKTAPTNPAGDGPAEHRHEHMVVNWPPAES